MHQACLSSEMWLLPSSRGEPEGRPPVDFVYVWLVCRWGGDSVCFKPEKHQERFTERGLGEECLGLGGQGLWWRPSE